jgi:hypothetical protein
MDTSDSYYIGINNVRSNPMPVLPPYPPEGKGIPRYGLQWNGPTNPLSVPMDDGYWTPWHLASAEVERLQARVAELESGAVGTDVSSVVNSSASSQGSAFILRKQAKAIEALIDASEIALWHNRTFVKVDCIQSVARRLYDEADSQQT